MMISTTESHTAQVDGVALRPDVFQPYVQHLAGLLNGAARQSVAAREVELASALDGQPGRELRKLYTAEDLRDTGTYFTGSELANRLVSSVEDLLPNTGYVMDPACGAGDLLVACARHFPLKDGVIATLQDWGSRLAGFDINSAFVAATRYRLALLAILRLQSAAVEIPERLSLAEIFPQIRPGSGISTWQLPASPSIIVVNPPFAYGIAAKGCTWTSGRVSQAALFMYSCLENAADGTRVLAILPDVLRTGARYEKWRKIVAEKARVHSVEIAGQFDAVTEISVFLLELEVGGENEPDVDWGRPPEAAERTVKDLFHIHVGPVVPFRLDGKGAWRPYAHSEELPPWRTVRSIDQRIRFTGTVFRPPFVAIRRTSKADYPLRCIGTLVTGNQAIAVENHFLIALPHDKKVGTCKNLLELLRRDVTSKWMNERIRCRHLTVGSVRDLPWPKD